MSEVVDIDAVEAYLRNMLKGEFSSLTIGFNEIHACNYVKAAERADDPEEYGTLDDWPSAEDRARAMNENSVWSIQWYPDTPVGFHRVFASTLRGAIESAVGAAPPKTAY